MLNWESEPTRNIHRCGGTCAKPVDTSLGTRNSWSTMARYRKGLPISSGIAESAVNQVVSLRMAKKRQMRLSDEGAHALAQVRVADRNGELSPRSFGNPTQARQSTVLRLWNGEIAMSA